MGPNDTLVAASLVDLVELARARGEYARMDTLAREVLAIRRRVYGDRHVGVAAALRRVAEGTAGPRQV
jgi:hypothetical protein